ncbi:IS21 family transposase [Gryllotalpicola reticulitermitis]|uniref:IS21 family transposase n=1 Tax=Gryllotalpicola reticulitermitis TaxID=1184153 RepID=A0ABV8Q682_9MICO
MDEAEPQLQALLAAYPWLPAWLIAERIGWTHSGSILRTEVAELRQGYRGVDPPDRLVFQPGQTIQCDLRFPAVKIPVCAGQGRTLPVFLMVLAYSRVINAVTLPSRQDGDLASGMWQLIDANGRVSRTLVGDREAATSGTGRPTTAAAACTGALGTSLKLEPARDPELNSVAERANQYLETSLLPGRVFASPEDFNAQLAAWLPRANSRRVRSLGAKPRELFEQDRQAMIRLPPIAPPIGITHRIRLAGAHYLRIDGNNYSADPDSSAASSVRPPRPPR